MKNTFQTIIHIHTRGKQTCEVTQKLREIIAESGLKQGILHVFCRHTSCSLVIMENADPSARKDLERFFEDLVPENYPHFVHTQEGPDDMPSHIKMALTRTSETIPFNHTGLLLGTWQGVFLWEHRAHPHHRQLVVTVLGD